MHWGICKSFILPPPPLLLAKKITISQLLTSHPPYSQLGVMTDSNNAPNDTAAIAGQSLALELRDTWAKNSGYPELSVYINYARGDEKLEQRYGARKLPRLAALKKKWDPREVFRFNNALPTRYP